MLAVSARAQQSEPEDPEDEKQFGLWLDQGISAPFSTNKSLEIEFHERLDQGGTNLFEYFVQGGVAFRPRPWVTLIPIYRYQRFPANPSITYENRLQFNTTLSTARVEGRGSERENATDHRDQEEGGAWRPSRWRVEGGVCGFCNGADVAVHCALVDEFE